MEELRDLRAEIDARLGQLEALRQEFIDGFALSAKSKLPFKVAWYRESLLWRTAQLA